MVNLAQGTAFFRVGETRSLMFDPVFPSPHLKKINDCKIFVSILKKQRPCSDTKGRL